MTHMPPKLAPDRVPPQNAEAEAWAVGAMLSDESAIDEALAIAAPEDYYRDDAQLIASAVRDMRAEGRRVDPVTVSDELGRRGQLERVGGFDALAGLAGAIPHAANAAHHATIIREHAVARAVIAVGREIADLGFARSMTASDLLAHAESAIMRLNEARATGETRMLYDLACEAMDRVEARRRREVTGLPTGIAVYDHENDGFGAEQLIVLAGRPKMGKSALGLNIAEHVALDCGGSVLFTTLEMGGRELAERSLAARSGVPGGKLRKGMVDRADLGALGATVERFRDARLFIDATPGRSAADVAANARRIKSRHGLDLCVVDYLQLLRPEPGAESRQEAVAAMSRRMKLLAMELKNPVLAMSQLNRKAEGREDRRPMLSDLRESGAIEQDADVVLLMHRPDYYDPNDKPGLAELIVAANRNGPTQTIDLVFLKELMKFGNAAPIADPIHPGDF